MNNTIKISLTVTAETDPKKLGEAIANLIRVVTPEEDWAVIAEQLKSTGATQVEVTADWDKEEELEPLKLSYTNPPDEPPQDA